MQADVDIDEALDKYGKLLTRQKRQVLVLLSQRELYEAKEMLLRIHDFFPSDIDIIYSIGLVSCLTNKVADSTRWLQQAVWETANMTRYKKIPSVSIDVHIRVSSGNSTVDDFEYLKREMLDLSQTLVEECGSDLTKWSTLLRCPWLPARKPQKRKQDFQFINLVSGFKDPVSFRPPLLPELLNVSQGFFSRESYLLARSHFPRVRRKRVAEGLQPAQFRGNRKKETNLKNTSSHGNHKNQSPSRPKQIGSKIWKGIVSARHKDSFPELYSAPLDGIVTSNVSKRTAAGRSQAKLQSRLTGRIASLSEGRKQSFEKDCSLVMC